MLELPGESVNALAAEGPDHALAVIGGTRVWRRAPNGAWARLAGMDQNVEALTVHRECVYAGFMNEAGITRISPTGKTQRLTAFDTMPGRAEWFAQGPPLGIRALTSTSDGSALMATVHVGGIPRSIDGGKTWLPTVPLTYDVHETRAHATRPNVVAAASAAGLCTSLDGGATWRVISEGLTPPHSLAVAMLEDETLFSIQDGPFAKHAQVWRWRIGAAGVEPVRDGLPERLMGKIDTSHISACDNRAALIDGAGTVWLSTEGSRGWQPIATGVQKAFGVLVI